MTEPGSQRVKKTGRERHFDVVGLKRTVRRTGAPRPAGDGSLAGQRNIRSGQTSQSSPVQRQKTTHPSGILHPGVAETNLSPHCCLSLPDEPGGWQSSGDRHSTQRTLPGLPGRFISRLAGISLNLGFHISLGFASSLAESEERTGRNQIRSGEIMIQSNCLL